MIRLILFVAESDVALLLCRFCQDLLFFIRLSLCLVLQTKKGPNPRIQSFSIRDGFD